MIFFIVQQMLLVDDGVHHFSQWYVRDDAIES